MASHTEGSHLPLWAFSGFVLAVCFVSGITGDVPDGVVYTDLQRTVQLGDRAVLKCQFYGSPLAVYWKNINDPSMIPKLIRRVEEGHDSGSCVQDKTCEMNDDYSLIIKNVTIADQGRYSCRVSNYKGIMIHNYTDLKVYATPEEPYPFINECKESGKNCTVTSQSPLNITCTASRYFPNIDLLFLHGNQRVPTIETVEWTNEDGTKSKLIFTRAPPSKIPYVCMAFNIPGSQDERTSKISVFDHHGNTTVASGEPTESDSTLFLKFALPAGFSVVAVFILVVLVNVYKKYQTRQNGTRNECTPFLATQRGKISYYELWFLASEMIESQVDQSKLRDIFKDLNSTTDISEEQMTQREAYQALCEWKQGNREVDQAKDLEEAMMKFHFEDAWTKMMDEKRNTTRKVSQETTAHILWHIGGIQEVNKFLRQLIPTREPLNANEKMAFVVEVALKALEEMRNMSFHINPVVLMSLALENAGCTPFERILFFEPDESIAPIQNEQLTEFTAKLTGRHSKRLAKTLTISKQKIDDYISGNNQNLFDTRSLITDWLREVECSNYEKRCRLDDAVIKIGRFDLQDFFKTLLIRPNAQQPHIKSYYFDHESVFDDDIPQLLKLVKWLPLDKKKQLMKKIGLLDEKEDDDDTLKDQMKAWRDRITCTSSDNKVSKDEVLKEFQSLRLELTNNTKYTELTLTDEEIEAVSSHLTSTDEQQELTSRLHIDVVHGQNDSFVSQLKQWRNNQAKTCRDTLQKALKQMGLAECIVSKSTTKQLDQEEFSRIAFKLMMEDVRPLTDVLGIDQEKVNTYVRDKELNNQDNCTTGLLVNLKKESRNREDFCKALRNIGFIDIARSVYFGENVL